MRFAWSEHWYALAPVRELPRNAPSAHTLLGTPLVVWRDGDAWHAARDVCPHRAAPLSRGRLTRASNETHLACAYHGWAFAGPDGALRRDPQSWTPPRCGVRMRPARVCARNLLWVWGDDAVAPAAFVDPSAAGDDGGALTDWISVRLPAPFGATLENNLDAAHALHTHSGFPLLDRRMAAPFPSITSGEAGGDWHGGRRRSDERSGGDEAALAPRPPPPPPRSLDPRPPFGAWMSTSGALGTHTYAYRAPHTVHISFDDAVRVHAYLTPSAADETVLVSGATTPHALGRAAARWMRYGHVRAVAHRVGATVAAQDARVMSLSDQEAVPMEYDAAITRVRRFLRRVGPPLPTLESPRAPARGERLSAWAMHGCRCPICRGFVRDLSLAKHAWLAAAFATAGTPSAAACAGAAFAFHRIQAWMRDDEAAAPAA